MNSYYMVQFHNKLDQLSSCPHLIVIVTEVFDI